MQHIAIMKKSWHLTEKILTGEKTIESRWYKTKHKPWDKIKVNDTIFFKDTGNPVTIKANVAKVIQFSNLNKDLITKILNTYGHDDGINKNEIPIYKKMFKDKKYCILIFLRNVNKIEPFQINKKGFGNMAAWITIDDIQKIIL